MIQTPYQEYLFVIGKLKDVYNLDVDVSHRDIHTFYDKKKPVFKLMFGQYNENQETGIVVSFYIDIKVTEAINWFISISEIHPMVRVAEVYIEDDKGETFLGEDAEFIKNLKFQREVLDHWLSNKGQDEMKEFVKSKIVGAPRNYKKSYDSRHDSDKAIIEFEYLKKPEDDSGDVH